MAADLNRRELLRLLSIAAPTGALAGTVDKSHEAKLEDLLGVYSTASTRLWRVYAHAVPKSAVLPLVNNQLRIVITRLRCSAHGRQQLYSLASQLFQLAGEIFFDQDRYSDAAHCYTMAANAAQEAQASDLWACAMTRHSFLYVYGQDFRSAVPLLDYAADIAESGDRALSTRQWVSVVQAQAYAGLGDLHACQKALDKAEEVRNLGPSMHNGGWLRFDGERLFEEQGACYAQLGRPQLATASLEKALEGQLSPRRRGSVHADLARIGLQRGRPDEFAAHARSAIDLAGQTQSGYVARRLRALRPMATPFLSNSAVGDIYESISALRTDQPT
jgi:tetratricopeptide (TPR) repeat protein